MWGVTLLPVSEASEPESALDVCKCSGRRVLKEFLQQSVAAATALPRSATACSRLGRELGGFLRQRLGFGCTYRLGTGAIFEEVRSFSSDSRQRVPSPHVLDPHPSDSPGKAGDHSNTGALSVDPEHGGRQLPRLGRHFVAIGRGRHSEASAS
ncbi:hypothetical protein NDU88_006555 [Pleurodeles waltl]|uniref:Uncharacterized protein n=1 Tax=Pleurodeles waltl TaxID=8319 RepID=A0AAV7SQ43_PLEWA|nr:hypothetical protein NDU88_006555 [Pleurodeles waltl]